MKRITRYSTPFGDIDITVEETTEPFGYKFSASSCETEEQKRMAVMIINSLATAFREMAQDTIERMLLDEREKKLS